MGLDMYLSEEKYISKYFVRKKKEGYVSVATQGTEIIVKQKVPTKNGKVKTVSQKYVPDMEMFGARILMPLMYWRKANAIHAYFIDKCADGEDNCRQIEVSYEDLAELRDLCRSVLADHSLAEELLPTRSGFFFGSTEYDEYYFQDLKETADMIDKIDPSENSSFYYRASW